MYLENLVSISKTNQLYEKTLTEIEQQRSYLLGNEQTLGLEATPNQQNNFLSPKLRLKRKKKREYGLLKNHDQENRKAKHKTASISK